jgi:glucose-1-phosphatase
MTIKAVIFDLGGVLVRTEDPTPRRDVAARLGLSYEELYHQIFDTESAIQATLGKVTTDRHWENVRTALNLSREDFQKTIETVKNDFFGGDYLDEGLVGYIRSLKPRYKTALLSNAWDNLRVLLEEVWQIADAFDEIVISSEVGIAKPVPEIFRMAVDRLGVSPSEAVFVDDFPQNISAAEVEGLHTIHFQDREQALAELAAILDEG